ncbi:MAG: putative glycosyl hydrolase [Actinomycetia bacterium]|nr:putative glycosyl hydrolase [Actinomycetes bacterium]
MAVLVAALAFGVPAEAATYAKGIDVSNWQGSIDWLQVGDDGNSFMFAKATEGTGYTDITYAVNRAGAQGVGLRLGAYHFGRPTGSGDAAVVSSAIAQADRFVNVAQPKPGDLPPVLDLEANGGLAQPALVRWTQAWLDEVAARTGVNALVYASPNFWKTSLGDTPTVAGSGHPLWIAHWTTAAGPLVPASNWSGRGWTFWQWSRCESVPGIAHCVDGDRANGLSVIPFAIKSFPGGPPVPSVPPTIVGTAKAGAKLAAVPGSWSGGKPVAFNYQWQSCDAAGAGCLPIAGATLEAYTPTVTDVGHALALTVTAVAPSGSAVASAPVTLAVTPSGAGGSAAPSVLAAPQVTGPAQVGQTLTASAGTWGGSPTTFAFAWRRCDPAGAACSALPGATASSYALTPGDAGTTLSVVVTATGKGGSQSATAPTTAVVALAPVPTAVTGSLVAQPGAAGAVVTTDGRATVTWQPGAVPTGAGVTLEPGETTPAIPGTGLSLTLAPSQSTLPWPLDVAYAAAPPGQVVAFSTDDKIWVPIAALTTPSLPGNLQQGTYEAGGVIHVLTRQAGHIALFRPGRWGDPRRISPKAPVVRPMTPLRVSRQRDGTILLVTRLSTSSQSHLYANVLSTGGKQPPILKPGSRFSIPLGGGSTRTVQVLVLNSGGFPVRLRFSGRAVPTRTLIRLRVTAIDPWGRTGAFTLSFRAP